MASILPLPEHVVAQIKSSTAIVSLVDVVLELCKNALDAHATRIDLLVDFAHGACTVEDDGIGIVPLEFSEEGYLGKLYCTSKHNSSEALLGRNGTFLASLAAVSLLAITSRHHHHRSHNSVTFHHAKAIQRQVPAPAQQSINGKHGTRVTVRNLFGNLPVRVKQRAKAAADKVENDRLWDRVKTGIVALLLSCQKPLSLRARDADNHTLFTFNTAKSASATHTADTATANSRSAHLPRMLNLLTQAGYISIGQWSSWVPISASTSSVAIKGTISLEPSPTRAVQFVSLGVQPVLPVDHNELFDHINRIFTLSSFGTIQDDADDELLQSGRRREHAGFTYQQAKTRKGVDRHPMFHLRISCSDESTVIPRNEHSIDHDAGLQAVVEVLDAMISQWLSVHHFRPLKPRSKRKKGEHESASSTSSPRHQTSSAGAREYSTVESAPGHSATRAASDTTAARTKKRLHTPTENLQNRAFAQWSRIKSGKASFFTDAINSPKLEAVRPRSERPIIYQDNDTSAVSQRLDSESAASVSVPPPAKVPPSICATGDVEDTQSSESVATISDSSDSTILWTDSLTRQTHTLNARTGCVIPLANTRPATDPTSSTRNTAQPYLKGSLRLPPRPAPIKKTLWLDSVLQTWHNPIFELNQQSIEQSYPQDCCPEQGAQDPDCARGNVSDEHKLGNTVPFSRSRLSRQDLTSAQVLAQVDKKFILVRTQECREADALHDRPKALLLLIDQHAADERIRVEQLLKELCAPVDTSCAYQSKLGHIAGVASVNLEKPLRFSISQQEKVHFVSHASRFASWGILFDVADSMTVLQETRHASEKCHLLLVTALPPSVSERCKADADLLITFLRSTVWYYASDSSVLPRISTNTNRDASSWHERLAACPKGLLDMINSRACRSAIMFNDELDVLQCKDLVRKLATCTFPFVCAHGRPSIVPLIDISSMKDCTHTAHSPPECNRQTFVQSWKQWHR